ncbi:MAG TPA: hypothetical protein VGB85_31025 [Nannocystis sp.]
MTDDRRERLDHLRGALQLLGAGIEAGTEIVEDMHRAIAATPLAALDAVSERRISRVHDDVSRGVYAWIRGVSRLVFRAADLALAHAGPALAPPAIPGPLVGVLHGILGDGMERDENPLRIAMHLRHDGRRVPVTPEALAGLLPANCPRLVVFVHGLACDESSWEHASVKAWGRPGVSYAALLRAQGLATLHVRYNSGLRVDANGRTLAALLGELLAVHPVNDLVLVGHSMGGLVVRSACHHGRGQAWAGHVRDVVCLGSPHGGAPLEQLGVLATTLLRAVPVTAAIGRAADRRSAGIKDLGRGTVVADQPCDEPLPHARYHFIAGSYGATARTRALGWAFGDGLVRVASARHDRGAHDRVVRVHLPGLHHMHLLNHPRVFAHLEATLLRSLVP